MHLDEEQVQRVMHRELAPSAEAPVRDHLATCAECRSRVARAEREEEHVLALLRQVDHAPPRVAAADISARARGRHAAWGRRAAGILVALGAAGVAYAAPGSPLPGWMDRVVARVHQAPRRPAPAPRASAPEPAAEATAGIAVAPGDRFTILFTAYQASGLATVSLTEGTDVVVRAAGGAATFTSDVDRLTIDNARSAAGFEIELPRRAPRVEIRVASRRVFVKDGSRVLVGGSPDAAGRYVLRLAAPDP